MLPKAYETVIRGAWKEEQIEQYLPLVKRIAGRLAFSLPSHIDENDLVGYGVFGLLDAVAKFDPNRGVKFETYASVRIRGSMIDGLRTMDWVPHTARKRVKEVQDAFAELEGKSGQTVTISEVADFLKMDAQEVTEVLKQGQMLVLTSFDEVVAGESGDGNFHGFDLFEDMVAQEAFMEVERQDRVGILTEAIEKLPDKEKIVVGLYYQEELTLKEIGTVLGLSESRISQLHSQAILRLRGRLSRQKKNLY